MLADVLFTSDSQSEGFCATLPFGLSGSGETDTPFLLPPVEVARRDEYPIPTSQEWLSLCTAAADGERGWNYANDVQAHTRTHQRDGSPFLARLQLDAKERARGADVNALESLTARLNADATFVLMYVAHCLAPTEILTANTRAAAWIDLNDVCHKIGLEGRSAEENRRNRRFIWNVLCFASRVNIIGERTIPYRDKRTGEVISTRLHCPPFSFAGQQLPVAPEEDADVPVRVELIATREWMALTTSPDTSQYLPLAEKLATIPPRQPSGAWARALGLALAHWWRRHPREALDGSRKPTRQELLNTFVAAEGHYTDVLASKNPRRVLDYWRSALSILADGDVAFLANSGEATAKAQDLPRQGWQAMWLKEQVDLRPGPEMEAALQACVQKRYAPKPRNLQANRRGPQQKRPAAK